MSFFAKKCLEVRLRAYEAPPLLGVLAGPVRRRHTGASSSTRALGFSFVVVGSSRGRQTRCHLA